MQPIMMSSQPPPAVRASLATASTSSVPASASASASSASSASPQLPSSPHSSTSDTVTCAAFAASSAAAPPATYSHDPSSAVHQQPVLNGKLAHSLVFYIIPTSITTTKTTTNCQSHPCFTSSCLAPRPWSLAFLILTEMLIPIPIPIPILLLFLP
ncbi:hypothetical protein J3F84DRAFT_384788 [Trichoderma pleuroticola]